MRVVRATGQNVSPSDDGRLYDQIFSDGLFTDTTFTNLGGNSVQIGAMYGDLCGRDFTVEQMTLTVTLPEGEGEVTGYIYVEIDTSSDDVITLNSALAPFTPTYEDINTNGAIAQMILAEYTATAVAVTGVTPVFKKVAAGSVRAGSVATVETAQATQNHSVGEFILLDKQLYIVTAAVSAGETFVEGTNISATSIGGELKALNNGLIAFETTHESTLASGVGRTISQNAQYTQVTITEKGLYLLSAETSGMNINGRTYAFFTGNNVIPALSLYPATVNTEYYHKQIVQFVKVGNTPITVSLRYWDSNNIPEHKYKIYKILG